MKPFNPDAESCPECHSDWRASLIPPESRHLYAGTSPYFSRLIGVEDGTYDGVSRWRCPDCKHQWDRWSGLPYELTPKARKALKIKKPA